MAKSKFFGLISNDPSRPLHYRFLKRQRHRVNKAIAASSKISNAPVLDPNTFEWSGPIAKRWRTVRDEALAICRNKDAIPPLRDISRDHRGIVDNDTWRSFFLVGYGHRQEANMARTPRTTELIEHIPGLNSAFFSILDPGSVITPHRGVTKAFITAHLGLSVPSQREKCWIRVEDQRLTWEEGQWLIFDDTYEHEVRNDSDETRIILLCQIARPLAVPGSWLASAFLSYVKRSDFVREAKENLDAWEDAFARTESGRS